MYMSTCQEAEDHGAAILHGSRGYFHTEKQPMFKVVYDAFKRVSVASFASQLSPIILFFLVQVRL